MKGKIKKYLGFKEKSEYDHLDKLLEMYLSGGIKKLLSEYSEVGIYPTFYKHERSIQIEYNFHNIYVIIDFFNPYE